MRTAAFASPYAATRGVYYVALLYNNSAQSTAPSIGVTALGSTNVNLGDITSGVKIFGTVSATSLGSTIDMTTLAASSNKFYLALY